MDLETFKSLVYPVRDKLFRFAFRIVQSEEEAKDIVQEAFVRIWNNMNKLKEVGNPEAWCMTITRNLAMDALKSRKNLVTDSLEYTADTLEESDDTSTTVNRIHRIIRSLPEKQRQVIHLRDIEGYTYEEISEILDYNMNQVKVTLHRARKVVREELIKLESHEI